uniref:SNF2 N-terminal domain-containing protein n=1 Tax=Buteo japonicus TaxID=224669 RepID=A0A8C0AXY6_9AVES
PCAAGSDLRGNLHPPQSGSTLSVNALKRFLLPEGWMLKGSIQLRPYQIEGVNWLVRCYEVQHGCILGDEMGLGKTCQVCSRSFLCDIHRQQGRATQTAAEPERAISLPCASDNV